MATDGGRRRGLLVDWGGVLTTPILEAFAAFVEEHGLDPDVLPRIFKAAYDDTADPDHPVLGIETGRLSEDEFGRRLASLLSEGRDDPLEAKGLRDRLFATVRPDMEMIAAVRNAREAGVRTGLVSNTWGPSGFPDELREMFDVLVLSGEVAVRKPDPAIYRLASERIGVPPERCVFVDDIEANVKGAESVGMRALLHRTADATIPELEVLFDAALRARDRD